MGVLSSQRIMTSGSERDVLVCVSINYFENAYSGILQIPETVAKFLRNVNILSGAAHLSKIFSLKCILKFFLKKVFFRELSYCASIFQMYFIKDITLQHNGISIAGKIEQSFCSNFHGFLFFLICLFLCFCLEANSLEDKFIKPYTGLSKNLG